MQTEYINHLIVQIDKKVARQLHSIMQHAMVQQLSAAWSGLHYLVSQLKTSQPVKIKVLDLAWYDLSKAIHRSSEVEHSDLFDKINNDEFGMPGGEPFALIIGDYQLDINPVSNCHSVRDIQALKAMAQIAAMSFTLFISSIKASAFGIDHYGKCSGQRNIGIDNKALKQNVWQRFRASEEARFIGLVLPQFLLNDHYQRVVQSARRYYTKATLLWGNAAYAYAAVFIRSFIDTGWFLDALGIPNTTVLSQGGITWHPRPAFS